MNILPGSLTFGSEVIPYVTLSKSSVCRKSSLLDLEINGREPNMRWRSMRQEALVDWRLVQSINSRMSKGRHYNKPIKQDPEACL